MQVEEKEPNDFFQYNLSFTVPILFEKVWIVIIQGDTY